MKPIPIPTGRQFTIGLLVTFAAAAIVVSRLQLHNARKAGEANALRADSISAVADTTRKTALRARDSVKLLGDSLAAVERRGVQLAGVPRDRFDKATDRTSVARGSVTVLNGPIKTVATSSPTSESDDVRSASFHVDSSRAIGSTRFIAQVDVTAPKPPLLATLKLGVTLPPIELEPRIQCGSPDAGGIRPATLAVVAPRGVDVTIGTLAIDVHACNPDFGRPRGIRVPLWVAAGGVLAGVVIGEAVHR